MCFHQPCFVFLILSLNNSHSHFLPLYNSGSFDEVFVLLCVRPGYHSWTDLPSSGFKQARSAVTDHTAMQILPAHLDSSELCSSPAS